MSISQDVFLRPEYSGRPTRLRRLQPFLKAILNRSRWRLLHGFARRVLAVVEPAGRVSVRSVPPPNQTDPRGQSLTVLSANLWHDWPRQRNLADRLQAFARMVRHEGVDIALLQEVSRNPAVRADEWLAGALGMAYVYSRANGSAEAVGFEEGLAIYSRFPLTQLHLRAFDSTAAPLTRRLALGATLDTWAGPLTVFSVHLSLFRKRNAAQLARLQAWIDQLTADRPALIGGDFNADETTPQIGHVRRFWVDLFRSLHPEKNGETHEVRCPTSGRLLRSARLDYLFLSPGGRRWGLLEARRLENSGGYLSDHRPVLARLYPLT